MVLAILGRGPLRGTDACGMLQRMRWLSLLLILVFPAASGQVYRSVAPDGTTTYSDQASPGAHAVDLPPPSSYSPAKSTSPVATTGSVLADPENAASEGVDGVASYDRFELVSPVPEDTIWDNTGAVDVAFDIRPKLREGDSVRVLVDGEPRLVIEAPVGRLEGLERGEHSLRAELLDADGEILKSSSSIIFYLHQHSLNSPARR